MLPITQYYYLTNLDDIYNWRMEEAVAEALNSYFYLHTVYPIDISASSLSCIEFTFLFVLAI